MMTQMHAKQSSGYSLLRMRRHAANVSVVLADCHTKADFHFPFEVKDGESDEDYGILS